MVLYFVRTFFFCFFCSHRYVTDHLAVTNHKKAISVYRVTPDRQRQYLKVDRVFFFSRSDPRSEYSSSHTSKAVHRETNTFIHVVTPLV